MILSVSAGNQICYPGSDVQADKKAELSPD